MDLITIFALMETAIQTNWANTGRYDLEMIPKMIEKGFKPIFNPQDVRAQRVTPEMIPQHAVSFVKGDLHVWQIVKNDILCWQTARLIDNHYCHHTPVKYLEDLFVDMK